MSGISNILKARPEFIASVKLVKSLYKWTQSTDHKNCPWHRTFEDQLSRAAVSVPINMSEGLGRATLAQRIQFYRTARGSAWEVLALLSVCPWDVPCVVLSESKTVCDLIDTAIREMLDS